MLATRCGALPMNPKVVDCPAPREPLYGALVTTLPEILPFQTLTVVTPDGRVTRHPLSADEPAVTVPVAW